MITRKNNQHPESQTKMTDRYEVVKRIGKYGGAYWAIQDHDTNTETPIGAWANARRHAAALNCRDN